ncbi:MAG TPA: hypothetical protein VF616_14530 [Duganella sp.]
MNLRAVALATLSTLTMISAARVRDICTAVADTATGKVLVERSNKRNAKS